VNSALPSRQSAKGSLLSRYFFIRLFASSSEGGVLPKNGEESLL